MSGTLAKIGIGPTFCIGPDYIPPIKPGWEGYTLYSVLAPYHFNIGR
jgi:hypothetical protein